MYFFIWIFYGKKTKIITAACLLLVNFLLKDTGIMLPAMMEIIEPGSAPTFGWYYVV
jgi:hypothetical protein